MEEKAVFIDADNINNLLSSPGISKEVGTRHIDLDGNDYWVWKKINVISPIVIILEYNSVFGIDRAISVPYDKSFAGHMRITVIFILASICARHQLSEDKGYSFVGCNSAGNNAYFIRNDKLNGVVRKTSLENGYVFSIFTQES